MITSRQLCALLAIALAALLATGICALSICGGKDRQIAHLNAQLDKSLAAPSPIIITDTIRDTVTVATTAAASVSRHDYKTGIADPALLDDIDITPSAVTSQLTTAQTVADSVLLRPHTPDSAVFSYGDHWATFRLSLRDTTLRYAVRDSIVTFVSRDFRHRFLWWRWGVKGYRVKLVNFNPHASVKYLQYVKVE